MSVLADPALLRAAAEALEAMVDDMNRAELAPLIEALRASAIGRQPDWPPAAVFGGRIYER